MTASAASAASARPASNSATAWADQGDRSRRGFLREVGQGMLIATLGPALAAELGGAAAFADEPAGLAAAPDPARLTFGPLEPLVRLLQETPIAKLNATLVAKLRGGMDLKTLTAAAALANARTFGGEDYVGFHTMMALGPAYRMSGELPAAQAPLPVLKVLYRNTARIHERGDDAGEVLKRVYGAWGGRRPDGAMLRQAVRAVDLARAENIFAAIAGIGGLEDAFNALLQTVQDNAEVHRVVLPYRAWEIRELVGEEHALTLLRQSVHYCIRSESGHRAPEWDRPRQVLPALFERLKLMDRSPGDRRADDAFIEKLSRAIFTASPDDAALAAASALAEGFAPDDIGQAVSLAANQLILRDHGRPPREESPGKPVGSVHGDSIGVHACDSANAWRNLARAAARTMGAPATAGAGGGGGGGGGGAGARNTFACLILGAWQVAFDRVNRGGDFLEWEPLPVKWHLDGIKAEDGPTLLAEAESAIKGNLQARAAAIIHRCGQLNLPARPVFNLMLKYAISEDGSLHAEKFYRTASEEFAATRPAFRWRQLVALARVTASEYGRPAAGMAEAREMLGA